MPTGAFHDAMRQAPVAWYASEERTAPVRLNPDAGLALAIDPLDGSSNIEIDVSIGTIFSILPAAGATPIRPRPSGSQGVGSWLPASSSTARSSCWC